MVIIPEVRAIFLHIPRTGGRALSRALAAAFPRALVDDSRKFIHAPRAALGDAWPGYRYFSVARSPYAIFASHRRWCRLLLSQPYGRDRVSWSEEAELRDYARDLLSRPFAASVEWCVSRHMLCRPPGFHATYLAADVAVFPYGEHWPALSAWLGRPLRSEWENSTPRDPTDRWTPAAVAAVADCCADDLARHHYPAPRSDPP